MEKLGIKGSWSGVVKKQKKDEGFIGFMLKFLEFYKDGVLIEYINQLEHLFLFDEKIKYQLLYDQLKKMQMKVTRRVIYS